MTWYNIVGAFGLFIITAFFFILITKNKQYRKGKAGEAGSLMMLAGYSSMVGVGFNSTLSFIFYTFSLLFSIIALVLAMKANTARIKIKKT